MLNSILNGNWGNSVPGAGCFKLSAIAYVLADGIHHLESPVIKALPDVNDRAIYGITSNM